MKKFIVMGFVILVVLLSGCEECSFPTPTPTPIGWDGFSLVSKEGSKITERNGGTTRIIDCQANTICLDTVYSRSGYQPGLSMDGKFGFVFTTKTEHSIDCDVDKEKASEVCAKYKE